MIDELHVCDVALIRDATMRPSRGLTVLTGETGAGKTALLSALKLLVGERADAGSVREGADALLVEGRVYTDDDPDGHVVRRRVESTGRGRVEIDGSMASVHELFEVVGSTVDLCGQHEHQRLLSAPAHLALLDAWGGLDVSQALAGYRACLDEARIVADQLERVRSAGQATSERLEEARFILDRIDEVSPAPDELDELAEALPKAEHAEALVRAADEAHEAISGDDGADDLLSGAVSSLRAAAAFDPALSRSADAIEAALIDVRDVAEGLRDYRDSVELDPAELARMQERQARLQGLMRTYGPRMADVLARRDEAAELVDAAGDDGRRLAAATDAAAQAEAALTDAADALDEVRRRVAPSLCSRIDAQMARLEMGGASLEFRLDSLPREQWGPSGPSHVELMYRPAAGLTARPLRRIASGGEVSRVMLAAKVVAGAADDVDTLVFDEVDAGVGGATAVALADVLADLARTHQVIVVTHLPQVAVRADTHYVVSKTTDGVPQTLIEQVDGGERVAEVARMLSGDASDAALAHAREMLAAHEA
jgi:DNA repair protein RecN (Recombination protein N)